MSKTPSSRPGLKRRQFLANLLFAGGALSFASLQGALAHETPIEEGWVLPPELLERLERASELPPPPPKPPRDESVPPPPEPPKGGQKMAPPPHLPGGVRPPAVDGRITLPRADESPQR